MIDTGITIKLFSLSELSEKAREKAIEDFRAIELSMMCESDFISGEAEYDTPEELQKAYDAEFKFYEESDEPIVLSIEINNYLFFENGEMARTIHYCGNHPLAGETHLFLNGTDYCISNLASGLQ